ncbi:glutamate racemase [Pseudomonas sp. 210_17 TE3656]
MDTHKTPFATAQNFWLGDETVFDGNQLFNSKRPIVVLDSGVGGLTVARQLEQLIPDASILYVADNDWFPYGSKPGAAVAQRVQQLLDQLCAQVSPLALVVACNTASIAIIEHGLDQLIQHCFLVTPPIEDALETSDNKNIVLLATPATVESKYISQEIAIARMRARIWPIATQSLVTLSESRLAGQAASFANFARLIDNHLTKKQRLSIDTVILGCTHFPHLIDDLRKIFPSVENWIDPAKKVALQIASIAKTKVRPINLPLKSVTFTSKQDATEYQQVFWKNGFSAT